MPTAVPFSEIRGHPIVPLPTGNALIDTGSPVSFGDRPIDCAAAIHDCPASMMGISVASLSTPGNVQIGALILKRFDVTL